jgi:thiamine pyrophosphate-dependent acetolactate synthase large subunit-like protein
MARAADSATVQVSGGDLGVRTLAKAGVTHAFGIHGGHLETIFQAS